MADQKPEQKSKLAKALEYQSKLTTLFQEAHDEAKIEIEAKIEELNTLGFHYQLVDGKTAPKGPGRPRGESKQRVCKICGQPGHNARTHDRQTTAAKA